MLNRGRKPNDGKLASVTVLAVGPLRPPDGLSEAQGKIWTEIVSSKPPGWFGRDSAALLESYCIAVDRRRFVTAQIERHFGLKRQNVDKYAQLLELERRQTATISSLSTKMRLSQQSRYTPQAAATATKSQPDMKAPWESED